MKFKALCDVEYTANGSTIRKGTIVFLKQARKDEILVKVGTESVLKPINASVFNICFKQMLSVGKK